MKRILVLLVGVLAATMAGCGSGPEPAAVMIDPSLPVTPTDAVYSGGWLPGPWQATWDGDVLRVSVSYLIGDEDGASYRLELIDDGGRPALRAATFRSSNWDGDSDNIRTETLSADDLTLHTWDPTGVVSGVIRRSGRSVPFWTDVSRPVRSIVESPTATVSLMPGELVQVGGDAYLQYTRILDDSRCPPETTCAWEGELTVELLMHHEVPSAHSLTILGEPIEVATWGELYSIAGIDAGETSITLALVRR